jgi:hypothetical protein
MPKQVPIARQNMFNTENNFAGRAVAEQRECNFLSQKLFNPMKQSWSPKKCQ